MKPWTFMLWFLYGLLGGVSFGILFEHPVYKEGDEHLDAYQVALLLGAMVGFGAAVATILRLLSP